MQGLRKREDSRFERFFALVQEQAKRENCIFFLDCGEGRDFSSEMMEGEDLSGWLIPTPIAAKFERQFLKDEIAEEWTKYVAFAIWEETTVGIQIRFQNFD